MQYLTKGQIESRLDSIKNTLHLLYDERNNLNKNIKLLEDEATALYSLQKVVEESKK